MQVQPTAFDAWHAIKKNQSTVDFLKNRIAQRRTRFKHLCDGTQQRDSHDEVMVQMPDVNLLDDDGTQKLLTVLEVSLNVLIPYSTTLRLRNMGRFMCYFNIAC